MNTRRNFLVKGSIATTALLATNPLKNIAGVSSRGSSSERQISFLHSANMSSEVKNKINRKTANHVVLTSADLNSTDAGKYNIIYKGSFKVGIISALTAESSLENNVNELASYLKNVLNCNLVVCISRIGYQTRSSVDEKRLAQNSEHIDLIISAGNKNVPSQPMILLNRKKHEVIVQAERDELCSVEIEFDGSGRRKHISFDKSAGKFAGTPVL